MENTPERKIPTLEEFKEERQRISQDLDLLIVRQRQFADKYPAVAIQFRLKDVMTTLQQAKHQLDII